MPQICNSGEDIFSILGPGGGLATFRLPRLVNSGGCMKRVSLLVITLLLAGCGQTDLAPTVRESDSSSAVTDSRPEGPTFAAQDTLKSGGDLTA